jgi:hypothetical protein
MPYGEPFGFEVRAEHAQHGVQVNKFGTEPIGLLL